MNDIERLLREKIGLDSATIGSAAIQRQVRLRMKQSGCSNLEQYARLAASSRAEWQELVETVVVPETWFFRDREPFAALARLVQEEWLLSHPTGRLRLLSIPCSTGEEPYSLAISLLEAGMPRERLQVDAVDISARVLAHARRGVYTKNSFRGADLSFRDRYFRQGTEGWVLDTTIRNCVRFSQGNLMSDTFLAGKDTYDFIFCRNLLIYFDLPCRQKVVPRLERLLTPSGVLFVGAAELPLVIEQGFVSARIPMTFACRRAGAAAARPGAPAGFRVQGSGQAQPLGQTQHRSVASDQPDVFDKSDRQQPQRQTPRASKAPGPQPAGDLERARRLADAGELAEAARICERYLQADNSCAQAHYLLGLVLDASGRPEAAEHYRKALYLDPHHYEALLQSAMWSEKNGDRSRARMLKNRAERIKAKEMTNDE